MSRKLNKITITENTNSVNHRPKIQKGSTSYKILYVAISFFSGLLIAIAVVLILTYVNQPTINDEYFTADNDNKTTISLTPSTADQGASSLVKTHFVYTYNGDSVSGLKTYFEYSNAESAKIALEAIKNQPEFKGAILEDKYIVVTAEENQFKGLTRADVKQQAEALREVQESQNSHTKPAESITNSEESP